MSGKYFNTSLTSALPFQTGLNQFDPNNDLGSVFERFSPDSKLVAYTNNILDPDLTTNQIGGIVYETNGGYLNPVLEVPAVVYIDIHGVSTPFGPNGIFPDPSFNYFVYVIEVIDNVNQPAFNTLAVQVTPFDQTTYTLGTPITYIFPNLVASGIYNNGAYQLQFTQDSRYMIVSYLDAAFNAYAQLFNVSTVTPVGAPYLLQTPNADGIPPVVNLFQPFQLYTNGKTRNYVSFGSCFGGINIITSTVSPIQPPFYLTFFLINHKGFTQVFQQPTAQFVNSSYAFSPVGCTLESTQIVAGSRATYVPTPTSPDGQPAFYTDVSESLIWSQSGAGVGNLVVYSFDGSNLEVIATENFDATICVGPWYNDGQTFSLTLEPGGSVGIEGQIAVQTFYRLTESSKNCQSSYSLNQIGKIQSAPQGAGSSGFFSPDGQYMANSGTIVPNPQCASCPLCPGQTGPTGPVQEPANNTVLLYTIDTNVGEYDCGCDQYYPPQKTSYQKLVTQRPKTITQQPKIVTQTKVTVQPKIVTQQAKVMIQPKVMNQQARAVRQHPRANVTTHVRAVPQQPRAHTTHVQAVPQKSKGCGCGK